MKHVEANWSAQLLGGDGQLKKGTQLKSVDMLLDYEIGFSLAVSAKQSSLAGWRNIVHFTASGGDCCKYGDRIPGVWFQPNTLKLNIVDGHTLHGNHATREMKECDQKVLTLQQGKTYKLKMMFEQRSVSVWVNGKVACWGIPREDRKIFKNVKVYASDPWHNPANAVLKGLYFKNHPLEAIGVSFAFHFIVHFVLVIG